MSDEFYALTEDESADCWRLIKDAQEEIENGEEDMGMTLLSNVCDRLRVNKSI